ncbi:MAG TPA: methyltransferase [Rhizomicrobium sp.]|jgi:tRNA1Val (adenine37-N6)-methyltransferase|nr:methyltransferase [Rhizomicrobium sp.]
MKTTEDRFLDARVIVRQPARGFRAGLDAVMLAAAVPARDGDEMLELGAGVGTASLCLASRVRCSVIGIEIDEGLAELANENAAANGMADRARFIAGDALAPPTALRRAFDHVFCNPPFHDERGRGSPDVARALAKQDVGSLKQWLSSGRKRTHPKGTFTTIIRADRLNEALAVLSATGISILPLWPSRSEAAKRVILQCRPGSRAPMALLPGLVLHENGGNTPDAEAILRGRACLARHFTGL